MSLYAQHGSKVGERLEKGLSSGLVEGVILSARDISLEKLVPTINNLKEQNKEVLFDPQIYIAPYDDGNLKVECLATDYNSCYYERINKELLGIENDSIFKIAENAMTFQRSVGLTKIISPNFLIESSLNSEESLLARQLFKKTTDIAIKENFNNSLYQTLIVHKSTLSNDRELEGFIIKLLNMNLDIKGFYFIIAENNNPGRYYNLSVEELGGALKLIHKLKQENYEVIAGYSDLYSPLFNIVGADCVSTGWLTSRRTFFLSSFFPSKGGSAPTPRYLSIPLLTRITTTELEAITGLGGLSVLNELDSDKHFTTKKVPQETQCLQTWEAILNLLSVPRSSMSDGLNKYMRRVKEGNLLAKEILQSGIRADTPLNFYSTLEKGIRKFISSLQ